MLLRKLGIDGSRQMLTGVDDIGGGRGPSWKRRSRGRQPAWFGQDRHVSPELLRKNVAEYIDAIGVAAESVPECTNDLDQDHGMMPR